MTNQAAQTMPSNIVERLASAKDKLPAGSDERMAVWRAIEYFRALSQTAGVPDVLFDGYAVYQGMTDEARARINAGGVSDVLDSVVRLIRAQAAPAASGGEDDLDQAARRMGDSARALLRDIAEQQVAASVSERARALMAQAYRDGGFPRAAGILEEGVIDSVDSCALRALEQALTRQRDTTPQPSADAVRELVKRWLTDAPDDAHSTSMWDQGYAHGRNECADELESLLSAASDHQQNAAHGGGEK